MTHQYKLVKLDAGQYYWHTEEHTDDGGFAIFNGDELVYNCTDEIEATFEYEWILQGGAELIDGKLIEKKGILA